MFSKTRLQKEAAHRSIQEVVSFSDEKTRNEYHTSNSPNMKYLSTTPSYYPERTQVVALQSTIAINTVTIVCISFQFHIYITIVTAG